MRTVLRLFLLAYFVMPIVSAFLVVPTFAQIRHAVTPVYESARTTISSATTVLETELRNPGNNFAPLVNTVNGIRSALQVVLNFLRDTVCTLVDLAFINGISANFTGITTELNNVITTTTSTIASYTSMIGLAVIVFVAWMLLPLSM